MTIKNTRKYELKWELIDTMFNKWEYWDELTGEEMTEEESKYLLKTIRSLAKHVKVTHLHSL